MPQTNLRNNITERVNNVLDNLKRLEKTLDAQPSKKEKVLSEKEKAEKHYYKIDEDHPEQSPYVVRSAKPTVQPVSVSKPKTLEAVEKVMTERLDKIYYAMDETKQAEFKNEGEKTAIAINDLIVNFKAQAKKVLDLIKRWLLIIPGVNKFFIEQESKIKTEKIIAYAMKYKREHKK